MVRAIQTTEGLLRGMGQPDREFDRVDAIMERQVPAWRGRPISEVWTPEVTLSAAGRGKWFQPGDGESARFVERRFSNWLEDEILFNPAWSLSERAARQSPSSLMVTPCAAYSTSSWGSTTG